MPQNHCTIIDKIAEQNKVPLFASYPELEKKIPYISFGCFPTPIQKLNKILIGHKRPTIYLKDDGVAGMLQNSNPLFGGNKIRKLEFLLADAQQKNASTLLAIGASGSNSVTCTATYAHKLGLECIAQLIPQPPSKVLQRNLLLMNHYDVNFKIFDRTSLHEIIIESFHECKKNTGRYPYPIPAGESSPRGILGFVNAAFELKNQIDNKLMPEPDKIYIPLGTGGSSLGLLIGIKALNLKTKIIAVAIEPMNVDTRTEQLRKKFYATIQLIRDMDENFPAQQFDLSQLEIRYKYSGDSYGLATSTAQQASTIFKKRENINLDGTYTAKAADCMLEELVMISKRL